VHLQGALAAAEVGFLRRCQAWRRQLAGRGCEAVRESLPRPSLKGPCVTRLCFG